MEEKKDVKYLAIAFIVVTVILLVLVFCLLNTLNKHQLEQSNQTIQVKYDTIYLNKQQYDSLERVISDYDKALTLSEQKINYLNAENFKIKQQNENNISILPTYSNNEHYTFIKGFLAKYK